MTMNMLTSALSLSNRDLLAALPRLAANERRATAELLAHLAALDLRPDVYAAAGYGSLYAYCTQALHLSRTRRARGWRCWPPVAAFQTSSMGSRRVR